MQIHPWMIRQTRRERGHGVLAFDGGDGVLILPADDDIPNNFLIRPVIDRKQRRLWLRSLNDGYFHYYPLKSYTITDEMMCMNEAEMLLHLNYQRADDGDMGNPEWLKSWVGVTRSYTCECCSGIHKLYPSYEVCPNCGSMYEYRSLYLPNDPHYGIQILNDDNLGDHMS